VSPARTRADRHAGRALATLLLPALLATLGRPAAGAGLPAPALLPADQQLLLTIDIARLRQHGPAPSIAHLEQVLGPRLASLGLVPRLLRGLVLGGGADRAVPEGRRPELVVIDQPEERPDLGALRAALGDDSPTRAAPPRGGVPWRRGRRVSTALLPDGLTLVGTTALLQQALDRAAGRGRPLAAAAAPLLAEAGLPAPAGRAVSTGAETGPPAGAALLSLYLRLPPSLQKDLRGAGAPAAPRELAAVGLPGEGGGMDLRLTARMAGAADAEAGAAWLRAEIQALAGETPVQLLGLSGLLRAVEVTADGPKLRGRLALGRVAYAGLLERLAGLGSLLTLRRPPAPR
jgi:hypothetical protein